MGLLRHPYANKECRTTTDHFHIENRSYLLPASSLELGYQSLPGKRNYLFDLGCGNTFQSSLEWLTTAYAQRQVEFDEIWAWEAGPVSSRDFWSSVPANIYSKIHFFNDAINNDVDSAANPVSILKSRLQQADVVVFKLDIDDEQLEEKLMQTLESKNLFINMTDLFYEEHFDAPEMRLYFQRPNRSWLDTFDRFYKLRHAGVRAHYWP